MWRFFKDFLIYGVAGILGKFAAIFLMPIYTSILTTEEYGAMALITSCNGIIDLISNLNIHSGIARDYYEVGDRKKTLVSTGFFSILAISTVVCLSMVSSRGYWAGQVLGLEDKYLLAFTLMLITIPTGSLMSYFSILTRYKKEPVKYAIGSVAQLVIQIGISIYCVVYLRTGISGIFWGLLISEVFAFLYFAFVNREFLGFTFDKKYLKRALMFSIPTLPAILAGWIDSSMGQIVIGKYISKADLGVYSVALSIASAFTLISTAFQNVWSPFLYENYMKPSFKRDIRRLFSIMVMALLGMTILLSLFSKEIILLLSNPDYLDAAIYVTILCLPMSVYLLFPFASSGVSVTRDTKYIGISYIAGSIMNFVLMFILVPKIGIIAVPLSLAASRCTTYTILYKVSERKIAYRLPNFYFLIIGAAVLIGYVLQMMDLKFVIRIMIGVVCYVAIAFYLSRKISLAEVLAKVKRR